MKKYIMVRCVLLCVAVVLLSGAASAVILQYDKEQGVIQSMKDILVAISLSTDPEKTDVDYEARAKTYMRLSFDYRLTILDSAGNVLGDSNFDKSTMENHANRPEVRQAMVAGTGYEKRNSDTYGHPMVYVAMRDGPLIYRIAAPVDSINATILNLIPALLAGLLLAIVVSPVLARRVAGSITKPLDSVVDSLVSLSSGKGQVTLMPSEFDELQPIASTVNVMTQRISDAVSELRRQREKTDYLLDNMVDGLVLVDNEMHIVQINAAARRFLGESKEVEGENLLRLTHQARMIEAVGSALENGMSTLFDIERDGASEDGRDVGGTVLAVHVSAVQSDWLAGGKANGAVILISDVTQERSAEQMRREFVANASHELKTPITSIGGFAELLATGVVKKPEQMQDYLGRICGETKRMAALIDDILRLSRLESGGGAQPAHTRVELEPVVREVLANLKPQLEERGLSAHVESDGIAAVMAQPEDMETLVTNLVENAAKYNREGGNIEVMLKRTSRGVRFCVRDTGVGIPAECQPRIFERFYRADKGRSRKVGGTGLGLAIVKHIVGKYGGEIRLKSTEGIGTEITVVLPAAPAQDAGPAALL